MLLFPLDASNLSFVIPVTTFFESVGAFFVELLAEPGMSHLYRATRRAIGLSPNGQKRPIAVPPLTTPNLVPVLHKQIPDTPQDRVSSRRHDDAASLRLLGAPGDDGRYL